MDELFEMLTLTQTRKLERDIPILLYGSEFWTDVIDFPALVRHGLIAAEDLKLFELVDDPDERPPAAAEPPAPRARARTRPPVVRPLAHHRPGHRRATHLRQPGT